MRPARGPPPLATADQTFLSFELEACEQEVTKPCRAQEYRASLSFSIVCIYIALILALLLLSTTSTIYLKFLFLMGPH